MSETWLSEVGGVVDVVDATGVTDVTLPRRVKLRFRGTVDISDNPSNGSTDIDISEVSETADAALAMAEAHAARHARGGADSLDGDVIDVDFSPTYYTRTTVGGVTTNAEELTSHLKGIDTELGRLINNQWVIDATTSRTLSASDKLKTILFTSASAVTVTIPAEATVDLGDGFACEIVQAGTGQVTVAGDGFTPLSGGSELKSSRQNANMTIRKLPSGIGSDKWLVTGEKTA